MRAHARLSAIAYLRARASPSHAHITRTRTHITHTHTHTHTHTQVNTDPKSGREYYYNKQLNKTQWERPTAPSNAPPPPPPPPAETKPLEAVDVHMYEALRADVGEHSAQMFERMREAKAAGDKALLLQHGLEYKYYKALVEWLERREKQALPLPDVKRVQRQVMKKDINPGLSDDCLSITVTEISEISTANKIQVRLLLPWPDKDAPQDKTAEPVKKCEDFAPWTQNFRVKRSKSLQLRAKGIKLQIEVSGVSKSMFSSKTELLGKAELPLAPLLASSTISAQVISLLDPENSKNEAKCGGNVTVTAKASKPWSGADTYIKSVDTLVIVLENSATNALGDPLPKKPPKVEEEHQRLQAAAAAVVVAPIPAAAGGASQEAAGPKKSEGKGGGGGGGGGGRRGGWSEL